MANDSWIKKAQQAREEQSRQYEQEQSEKLTRFIGLKNQYEPQVREILEQIGEVWNSLQEGNSFEIVVNDSNRPGYRSNPEPHYVSISLDLWTKKEREKWNNLNRMYRYKEGGITVVLASGQIYYGELKSSICNSIDTLREVIGRNWASPKNNFATYARAHRP